MKIDYTITPLTLTGQLEEFWQLAAEKVHLIEKEYDASRGSPVFTANGKYTTRGWTEWTQGFQYGIPLLVFSATGNREMLESGKMNTMNKMAHHVTHFGVHDHGFNNLSTYGNLLRCSTIGLFEATDAEVEYYKMALMASWQRVECQETAITWKVMPTPEGESITQEIYLNRSGSTRTD